MLVSGRDPKTSSPVLPHMLVRLGGLKRVGGGSHNGQVNNSLLVTASLSLDFLASCPEGKASFYQETRTLNGEKGLWLSTQRPPLCHALSSPGFGLLCSFIILSYL